MVVYFTVDSAAVQNKLKGASQKLRNHVYKKLHTKTAPAIKRKYTQFAPKGTGRLSRDRRTKTFKKSMKLQFIAGESSFGSSGFDYAGWVTGRIPTITARTPYFPAVVAGKQIKYGQKIPGVNFKASPRWFDGVVKYANRKVPQDVNQAIKDFTAEMNS